MIHQYHFALLHHPNTMETDKKICCLCNNTLLEFYRTKTRQAYFALSSAYRYIYSRKAVPPTSQIPRAASSESYPLTKDGRGLVKGSILERIEQVIPLSPSSVGRNDLVAECCKFTRRFAHDLLSFRWLEVRMSNRPKASRSKRDLSPIGESDEDFDSALNGLSDECMTKIDEGIKWVVDFCDKTMAMAENKGQKPSSEEDLKEDDSESDIHPAFQRRNPISGEAPLRFSRRPGKIAETSTLLIRHSSLFESG